MNDKQVFLEKEFNKICAESNLVGASSIIVKDGKIVNAFTYGYESKEKNLKTTLDTVYRIASVSKLEVASCIMMLVSEGKLDLDEDISTYLHIKVRNPRYPDNKITLRMVLTQTSSIKDGYEIDEGDPIDSGYILVIGLDEEVPLEEVLLPNGKYFVDECFNDSIPGTKFEYSNFGCGIMACIIERVTGVYFFDFVKENFFKKIGVNASFMASDMKEYPIASTYYQDGSLCRDKEKFVSKSIYKHALGHNFVGPAGGLFVSIKGLAEIMMQYMNDGGKVLNKDTMDMMLQMNWFGDRCGDYTAKGLQFQILDYFDNRRLYGHFGGAYGVRSFLFFNPHQKLGFVFVTNGGGFKYMPSSITDVQEKLLKLYLDTYWDNKLVSNFKFTPGEEYGYLDGRKLKINYLTPINEVVSKKPYINYLSMLDAFQISTYNGKEKTLNEMKDKHVFEYLEGLDNEFEYNCEITEAYPNNNYLDKKNAKFSYEFNYVRKENKKKDKLSCNLHTHCDYCDHASGKVADYIDEAFKCGYKMIGMSDHGPMKYAFLGLDEKEYGVYFKSHMDYNTFKKKYIKDIDEAIKKYKDQMDVLKSVEIEYISGHDDYYKMLLKDLDYLLLGQHFSYVNGKELNTYYNVNSTNVIDYAKEAVAGLDTGLFRVMAHPDLFMYRYINDKGEFRIYDEAARKASRMIIEACARNNVLMELNVGGVGKGFNVLADGSKEFAYPRSEFWKIVKEYPSIEIVIGCDAHKPSELSSANINKLIKVCKEWGLNVKNIAQNN